MSDATKRLATDNTLQATNTALGNMNTALGNLAKDSTLGSTNTALGNLAKDSTLGDTNTALGNLAKDSTLSSTNTALAALASEATLQALVNVLVSVKSVNGEYGVVVLDSGDILIAKSNPTGKTVKTVLEELAAAIALTPLEFTATLIADNDYKITVTQGTPE